MDIIETNVRSVDTIGVVKGNQRITFTNSDIVIFMTDQGNGDYSLIYKLRDKSFDAKLIITGEKYEVTDLEGNLYYSVQMDGLEIRDYEIGNTMPFSAEHSYFECMKRHFTLCSQQRGCQLLCSFSMASCILGFSVGCAVGIS